MIWFGRSEKRQQRAGRHHVLLDPGLQPERTALSWRRTSLSVAAGSAILLRLSIDALGMVVLIPALTTLLLAMAAGLSGPAQYRRMRHQLTPNGRVPGVGAGVAALAAGVFTLSTITLVAALAVAAN